MPLLKHSPVLDRGDSRRWNRALCSLLLLCLLPGLPGAASPSRSFNAREYLGQSGFRSVRDSLLSYSADSLHMDVAERQSRLSGNSGVRFQNLELRSPEILVDWKRNLVEAWIEEGQLPPDAGSCGGHLGSGGPGDFAEDAPAPEDAAIRIMADTGSLADSLRAAGLDEELVAAGAAEAAWPHFSDGALSLSGQRMSLDLKTRQGHVIEGRTAEGLSRYGGSTIKRVAPREMHVDRAIFTTCDEDCPHYHFQARELKMLVKDRVLARDVFLCFGNVKTLYSPVATFSLKRGRASGLILPSYGETAQQGRKLDHLGWYWAVSDYWDTQLRMSYAEKGPDWLFVNRTVYRWDARHYGNLSASYNLSQTSSNEGWDLRWRHSQALTPYIGLKGDLRLASSRRFYESTSDNLETRLTRNLTSNLNLSGRFPAQQISWSLNANATQDLEEGQMSGILPRLSLRFPTVNPFRGPLERSTAPHGSFRRSLQEWLGGAVMSISSTAQTRFSMQDWDYAAAEKRSGAEHRLGLSVPGRLGVFSLTPRLNLREQWVNEVQELSPRPDGGLDTLSNPGFAARHTFSLGLASSTKLYGIARPRIGRLLALRHVLTPSLNFSWAPDFSKESWGYVESAVYGLAGAPSKEHPGMGELGEEPRTARLDRFAGSLYGATPSRETLRLGFSLDQLFQGKWRPRPGSQGDRDGALREQADLDSAGGIPGPGGAPEETPFAGDTGSAASGTSASPEAVDAAEPGEPDLLETRREPEPVKSDLLNISSSSSYDFTKESFRLADLSSRWRMDPLQVAGLRLGPVSTLSLSMTTVHTFYKTDPATGSRIDCLIWTEGNGLKPRLPRLIRTGLTLSTRFSGGRGGGFGGRDMTEEADSLGADRSAGRFDPQFGSSDMSLPWDLNFSWSWSRNSSNPLNPSRSNFLNASGSLRFSPNWKISTGLHYDFIEGRFSSNSIRIYRDMHCWEGRFTWNPRGPNPSYHLLITVKSELLRDLKWDKRKGRSGTYHTF